MYESFYGLKEKPFSMLPDPGFLYLSKKHQKALTLFEYGLMNHAGFCVISGEIGSGKTTILRKLLENMDRSIAVGMITNTHKGFGELLDWVLSAFGIHEKGLNEVEKHQKFIDFLVEQYAANKTTLLIVDEAQNMAADKLEELRMLSNVNSDKDQVLQIILAGQPELKDTLGLPELKQFVQRIAVDYHLGSLDEEDTCAYITHRLSVAGAESEVFTEEARKLIYKYSGGTPRLINLLCDTAMVYGFADQQAVIDEDLVAEMIIERMQNSLVPLACSEPPKKKLRNRVDETPAAGKAASKQAKETPVESLDAGESSAEEHDFGEKVLQASTAENAIDVDKGSDLEEKIQERDTFEAAQESVSSEPEELGLAENVIESIQPGKQKQSHFFKPVLLALFTLFVVTVFFSLSLEDDLAKTTTDVVEVNKYKKKPESINRSTSPVEQEVVQTIPDEIKKQLDESQKIQREMAARQQEDRARMQVLEEQAALLKSERDKALINAKAEKEKRVTEAEAARISAEREKAAEAMAQTAIAEAMAAERKAKLLEELRQKEKQASAEAMAAQQKKLDAVVESVELLKPEPEKPVAEVIVKDKKSSDARCQGATARFLSICR